MPPPGLECTGLYSDLAAKVIAEGVRAYTPAVPLWSDGAEKKRWIALPPGTQIDGTNPDAWKFPVGTKVWKEFSQAGRRMETRLWQKVDVGFWVHATYAWNADETAAALSPGGDVQAADGTTYHIPTSDDCQQCHRGRPERILGFEAVLLGLPGASGLTLDALAAEGLLAPAPPSTHLSIGDDGTGMAAPVLGWLHVNCGTSCHNTYSDSTAYSAGLKLRLDPRQLDGRPSSDFDLLKTSLEVPAHNPNFQGAVRIVPGDPDASLLVQLIGQRGDKNQMPPIATRIVDTDAVQKVAAWVRAMPAPAEDGGVRADAGADGGIGDAGSELDGGRPDGARADAGRTDAGGMDAGRVDAGRTDAGSPLDGGALDGGRSDAGASADGGRADGSAADSGRMDSGRADSGSAG